MMIESDGLIDLSVGDGPLCPNAMPPVSAQHAMLRQIQDAAYRAAEYDTDGEPVSAEAGKVVDAVHYGPETAGRMRLYRDTVAAQSYSIPVAVEALYFRCTVCGLVLPANRVPTR
jgi:hypothetical protein